MTKKKGKVEDFTPLHELNEATRIEQAREILEKEKVDESKWSVTSFLMGVAEQHAIDNGVKLDEDNVTGDIDVLARMTAPMITRGFAQTSAMEICGVFPMSTDQGKIAYMQNFYTNDSAVPSKPSETQILILADASAFAVAGVIEGDSAGTNPTATVLYIEDNSMLIKITTAGTGFVVGMDVDNASAFSSAETTISSVMSSEIGLSIFKDYMAFSTIADAEAASTTIKEIELSVDLANVTAVDHELRIRYTKQFNARLRDNYGEDADSLTDSIGIMAFRQSLNKEIFSRVLSASTTGGTYAWNFTSVAGRWEEEKVKTLVTALNFRQADILTANFMEGGTFGVIDPITFAFLKSYGHIDTSVLAGGMAQPMKNPFVGILNGSLRMYVNPWLQTRTISVGMKDFSGDKSADTRAGIFFHPYLAIDIQRTVDASTGQNVKYLWSMYGFTDHPLTASSGSNDFFRRINCSNLPHY